MAAMSSKKFFRAMRRKKIFRGPERSEANGPHVIEHQAKDSRRKRLTSSPWTRDARRRRVHPGLVAEGSGQTVTGGGGLSIGKCGSGLAGEDARTPQTLNAGIFSPFKEEGATRNDPLSNPPRST